MRLVLHDCDLESCQHLEEQIRILMKNTAQPITVDLTAGDIREEEVENQRTPTQNNALHLFCRQVAQCLNDSGLDMKKVLAVKTVDVSWTEVSVKEILWKPIQKAMTDQESTTKVDTKTYSAVHMTLCRHFSQNMGVALPSWPDRHTEPYSASEGCSNA